MMLSVQTIFVFTVTLTEVFGQVFRLPEKEACEDRKFSVQISIFDNQFDFHNATGSNYEFIIIYKINMITWQKEEEWIFSNTLMI